MECRHIDAEALLRAAYGVATAVEAEHLRKCGECATAVNALESRRGQTPDANVLDGLPEAFWHRQRRAILARIEQPTPVLSRRFAVSVAMVVLLAVVVLATGREAPQKPLRAAEDEQLLQEINLIVNHIEPRALTPAALFLPDESKEVRRP